MIGESVLLPVVNEICGKTLTLKKERPWLTGFKTQQSLQGLFFPRAGKLKPQHELLSSGVQQSLASSRRISWIEPANSSMRSRLDLTF